MFYGLLAAILFGISAPLSKLLVVDVDPIILAGLLYLGAGGALGLLLIGQRLIGAQESEARLDRDDVSWLIGAVLTGGVVGPILLLLGIRSTPAATASLLLNVEVVATGFIAFTLFRESVGKRAWMAISAVALGGILLSVNPSDGWGISGGALLILGACTAWGFDNNFTGHISLKDPKRIVAIKGLAAGSFSLLLGLLLARPIPSLLRVLYGLLLGTFSYGASIALFVHSLRRVGAARTGALFGMAPFVGVLLSVSIYRQWPEWTFFMALPLMILAAWLLSRENHSHEHIHAMTTHSHRHRHDDGHHEHDHDSAAASEQAVEHVHRHTHGETRHAHPHSPDPHHRHEHVEQTNG